MPRSEHCRIRGNCLNGIVLLSLAQVPAADGAPGDGRAAPASGGSSGRSEPSKGLEPFRRPLGRSGERSKPVSEALRTVARHGRGAGGRATRPSWMPIGAGPAARLLGSWAARAGRARPSLRSKTVGADVDRSASPARAANPFLRERSSAAFRPQRRGAHLQDRISRGLTGSLLSDDVLRLLERRRDSQQSAGLEPAERANRSAEPTMGAPAARPPWSAAQVAESLVLRRTLPIDLNH